jgi:hypothetical protein
MSNLLKFYTSISRKFGECKMQLMSNGFNTFKVMDSTHANADNSKDVRKFTNLFKYKFEALYCYVCFNIYTNKSNM